MPKFELLLNLLAGGSAISWAVLGIWQAEDSARLTTSRLCIAALNLTVGVLFLTRRPMRASGGFWTIAACLPSFLIGAAAYKHAPSPELWPLAANFVFLTGTALTATSLLYLGRCFAVLPAIRGCVASGPFRLIRHPAYAGELIMVTGCLIAEPKLLSLALVTAAPLFVAMRIIAEENLLKRGSPEYNRYTAQVRWRLLPGVW